MAGWSVDWVQVTLFYNWFSGNYDSQEHPLVNISRSKCYDSNTWSWFCNVSVELLNLVLLVSWFHKFSQEHHICFFHDQACQRDLHEGWGRMQRPPFIEAWTRHWPKPKNPWLVSSLLWMTCCLKLLGKLIIVFSMVDRVFSIKCGKSP